MRINRLVIKDLGKHKKLDFILGGPVVGLMGANGSGKSTILKIIHFLMTGYTPPKEVQESFLRRVDPELEEEPSFGLAEIEFSSQGAHCKLSRRVGVASTRRLEIDDKVYTRADEIQYALTDILGADKYAIDNAVFPAQGELDKVIFGSQADREELLVKLLLLGHMQKVADIAASKIKILGSEIQDFSVLHDELLNSRRLAEEELGLAISRLNKGTSYDLEIDQFYAYNKISYDLEQLGETIRKKKTTISTNIVQFNNILQAQAAKLNTSLSVLTDLSNLISKLRTKMKEVSDEKTRLLEHKSSRERFFALTQHLEKINAEYQAASALLQKPITNEEMNQLVASHTRQLRRQELKKHLVALQIELGAMLGNLKVLKTDLAALTLARDQWDAEFNRVRAEQALYGTIMETCAIALSGCNKDCPVCGSDLTNLNLQKRHDTAAVKWDEYALSLAAASTRFTAASNSVNDKIARINRAEAAEVTMTTEMCTIEQDLCADSDLDINELSNNIQTAQKATNVYYQVVGTLNSLKKDIEDTTNALSKFSDADRKAFSNSSNAWEEERLAKLTDTLTRWEAHMEDMQNTYTNLSGIDALLTADNKEVAELNARVVTLTAELNDHFSKFSPRLMSIINSGSLDIEKDLKDKNQVYVEAKARAEQLKIQTNGIKKRLLEIEDKIALDADKRAVISELQRLIAAFSRSGIPMAYVQHKFDSLVSMTQENLEIMDANFAIVPHATRPVSLQFYRVDEPGQVLFDHEKLSGGQKGRVSIAFLLAVQQLLIPDLGFLVLDEPSMGLDTESKENLKDLLLNIGHQLETTDNQILVCDHAQELEPAFYNFINL